LVVSGSICTRTGTATRKVFEAAPAAILPVEDQMISLPPSSVKIREVPTLTLSRAKMLMLPPPSVRIPWSCGWFCPRSKPTVRPPQGARMLMSPPLCVLISREVSEMSPLPGLGNRSAIAVTLEAPQDSR
jgi:hypothetical protein